MNPFEIFGLAPTYRLDTKALEERFRELSKVVHPDKHAAAGAKERRLALSRAVDVNAAYRVLRDPVKRAEALLALAGHPVDEREKADPTLLMEVMEHREALADVRAKRDAARLAAARGAMESRRSRVMDRIADAIERGAVRDAAPAVAELRYVARFLDEVRAIEDELS